MVYLNWITDKWISIRIWLNCRAIDWSTCVGSLLDGPFPINYIGTNQLSLLHTTSYEVMFSGVLFGWTLEPRIIVKSLHACVRFWSKLEICLCFYHSWKPAPISTLLYTYGGLSKFIFPLDSKVTESTPVGNLTCLSLCLGTGPNFQWFGIRNIMFSSAKFIVWIDIRSYF